MNSSTVTGVDALTVEVLRGLAEGATDQQVARQVNVSARTVQRVIDGFKASSGARTRFAAGAAACRMGLLEPTAEPRLD